MKTVIVTFLIVLYEFVLIDFAANNFSISRSWFRIVNNVPMTQSNIEFVIYIGQVPVLFYLVRALNRKLGQEERSFIEKYEKKDRDKGGDEK